MSIEKQGFYDPNCKCHKARIFQAAYDLTKSLQVLISIFLEALAKSENETALVNGLFKAMTEELKKLGVIIRKVVFADKKTLNAPDLLPVVEKFLDAVLEIFDYALSIVIEREGCTNSAIKRIKGLLDYHGELYKSFFENCEGDQGGTSLKKLLDTELKGTVEPLKRLLSALFSEKRVFKTADPAIVKKFVDASEDMLRFVLCLEAYLREANGVEDPTGNAEARLKDLLEDYEDPDDDSSES
ncbi:MAG: hypothetical protein ACOX2O_04495 [Bdellovibrionota bacterium]|jgi:hypothetical protein